MVKEQSNLTFFSKCQELINSSFILFETKLEDTLYSLASSPLVYSIIEKCVTNYSYNLVKNKYLISPTQGKKGYFVSPSERREFIAFASNLLYDLYDKKILFTDLLDLYFQGDGYKEKFEQFKQAVLVRWYNDLYSVLQDMEQMYYSNKNENITENISKKDLLKNLINNLKLKQEDKDYLEFFIDKLLLNADKEICLKAIEYILLNYKKGQETCLQIKEIING